MVLFLKAPRMAGGRFKFNQIDPDRPAREIRPAVEALENAGVIRLVHHTAGQGVPLAVDSNPRISNLFFLDVGLMHASLNIDAEFVQEPDLLSIHRGAVAEQFVAQELLACAPPDREPELWFWTREAPNSQAEVDFLIPRGMEPVPIEVKTGAAGAKLGLAEPLSRGYRAFGDMPILQLNFTKPAAENGTPFLRE